MTQEDVEDGRNRLAPYFEGHAAWEDGLTDADNPYEIGSDEAMEWNDGWNEAANEGK